MEDSFSDVAEEVDANLYAILMNPEVIDTETKKHLQIQNKDDIFEEMKLEELENLEKQEKEEKRQDEMKKLSPRKSPKRSSAISKHSPYVPKTSRMPSLSRENSPYYDSPPPPKNNITNTAFMKNNAPFTAEKRRNSNVSDHSVVEKPTGLAALFGNAEKALNALKNTPKQSAINEMDSMPLLSKDKIEPLPDASPPKSRPLSPQVQYHSPLGENENNHHHISPRPSPHHGSPRSPYERPSSERARSSEEASRARSPHHSPSSHRQEKYENLEKINSFKNYESSHSKAPHHDRRYLFDQESNEDMRLENQAADLELRRLEREGIILSKSFTADTPLPEKLFEIESHKKNKEMIEWVNSARDTMALGATGLDVLNDMAGPILKLRNSKNSWVKEFNEKSIDKMTEPLKKIYSKYIRKSESNPIFQIVQITVGSLVGFHAKEVIAEKFSNMHETYAEPILPNQLKYNGVTVVSTPNENVQQQQQQQQQQQNFVPQASVSAENVPSRPMMEEP